jgi:hypothetical protein
MNIPVDEIYHYLSSYTHEDTIIYHFFPYGEKKLEHTRRLQDQVSDLWAPKNNIMDLHYLLFHDQEVLDLEWTMTIEDAQLISLIQERNPVLWQRIENIPGAVQNYLIWIRSKPWFYPFRGINLSDKWLLVHSEQRSHQVDLYRDTADAVPVYWWSHAMIARDWYRYAEVDPRLGEHYPTPDFALDFNVYNRAWIGSREYRLKFTDLIIQHGLVNRSNITFNGVDQGTYYRDHVFRNPRFAPINHLDHLPTSRADSHASATYSWSDYNTCAIDCVLETLFDDQRWHLTEKIMRPIACGKPFILVSTPGALQYLKSYGFRSFDSVLDESYDDIPDPLDRLKACVEVMHRFSTTESGKKKRMIADMHDIAAYNRSWFWSQEFQDRVINEFVENYRDARDSLKQHRQGNHWRARRKNLAPLSPEIKGYLTRNNQMSVQDLCDILRFVRDRSSTS